MFLKKNVYTGYINLGQGQVGLGRSTNPSGFLGWGPLRTNRDCAMHDNANVSLCNRRDEPHTGEPTRLTRFIRNPYLGCRRSVQRFRNVDDGRLGGRRARPRFVFHRRRSFALHRNVRLRIHRTIAPRKLH